jgi:hypothetical protein
MGVNMSITRMKVCDFEKPSELPITRAEVLDLVDSDPTLCLGDGDMIFWFPEGNPESKIESENFFFFDEEVGILYSQGTREGELQKLVEVAEKLNANLLDEENAIYLPSGEILDEAWKGESLQQRGNSFQASRQVGDFATNQAIAMGAVSGIFC